MTRRGGLLLLAWLLVGAACTGGGGGDRDAGVSPAGPGSPPPPPISSRWLEAACGLPGEQLLRIWRGYHPERSGELQIVPKPPIVVAEWLSHAGPWEHVQRVPLFFYGPGHVPPAGRVDRPATAADVAPTLAELIGAEFDAPDGNVLDRAVAADRRDLPKMVLTIIWDSAGRNVLAEHPDAWPTLRELIPEGLWFDRATVGTSPSTTPAVHAAIGTGAFPRRHGLVDLRFRLEGSDEMAWIAEERPEYLLLPTLADRHGAATGQRARIGLIASPATLGMLGHGTSIEDGGPHLVAQHRGGRWEIGRAHADAFRFPEYVNEVGGLEEGARRMDLEDGRLDGAWQGERVLDDPAGLSFSPAFAEHQTRVVEEVIRREGFGRDDVPDLLFVNYKQIDTVGHRWTMNSPQMEAVVRSSDEALARLVEILDREVGRGAWVLALTADHGSVPDPRRTGAFIIDLRRLAAALQEAFDTGDGDGSVIERVRPTQVWIDETRLEANGFDLEDVAGFAEALTKGDVASDPLEVPEAERDDPVFDAVFPGAVLTADFPPCGEPSG